MPNGTFSISQESIHITVISNIERKYITYILLRLRLEFYRFPNLKKCRYA